VFQVLARICWVAGVISRIETHSKVEFYKAGVIFATTTVILAAGHLTMFSVSLIFTGLSSEYLFQLQQIIYTEYYIINHNLNFLKTKQNEMDLFYFILLYYFIF